MSRQKPVPEAGAGLSRRTFLGSTLASGAVAAAMPLYGQTGSRPHRSLLDILRAPDSVTLYTDRTNGFAMKRNGEEWRERGATVTTRLQETVLNIRVSAPDLPVQRVHLRWRMQVQSDLLVLGDAWERSYGELSWRGLVPERVMPWYFATSASDGCHAYGVRTAAGALCFWQLDPQGVSLWLDTANGGGPVLLRGRELHAATVLTRPGVYGEDPFSALRDFCRRLCVSPPRPAPPIYGFNDWYYAYGKGTATGILADADFLASLSAGNAVRPFSVVDDGWEDKARFPDMARLAGEIKAKDVRPGVWIRPLAAPEGTPRSLLLPDSRFGERRERTRELAYDPTNVEARERVLAKVSQVVAWGYEMVKHDFSTYDLLGQWGFEMGGEPTQPGWSLQDRSRTNAEVIRELYLGIRERCDPGGTSRALVLGCNAVGHLGQGLFDAQRTGDDTSGKMWERTRRMGVNTLAFRLPQHGTFFVQDADCVGIAPGIAWEQNRQWLDVLARSGTAVFVSPGAGSRGPEQAAAIRAAFALAAGGGAGAQPRSWLEETTPGEWAEARSGGRLMLHYDWCGAEGASPFTI